MTPDLDDLSASIARLGKSHPLPGIEFDDLDADPFAQFGKWLKGALEAGVVLPNAMTLATADASGKPSARIVLLKGFDEDGFVFFTNYLSRKGKQLAENPNAALVWHWMELERQVGVTGAVERVSDRESDDYFASRPQGSKLGAWVSNQSEVIPDRAALDGRLEQVTDRFHGREVPRPPYWGGFRLIPDSIEFWQARPDRLHDRFRYMRDAPGSAWTIKRLAP